MFRPLIKRSIEDRDTALRNLFPFCYSQNHLSADQAAFHRLNPLTAGDNRWMLASDETPACRFDEEDVERLARERLKDRRHVLGLCFARVSHTLPQKVFDLLGQRRYVAHLKYMFVLAGNRMNLEIRSGVRIPTIVFRRRTGSEDLLGSVGFEQDHS